MYIKIWRKIWLTKIQITLSDEVLVKLENLAKEKGVSKSAMISILITEENKKARSLVGLAYER